MKLKIKATLIFWAAWTINTVSAQDTLSVLFLGNSYTSYNNLPQLVQSLSSSAGKTLIIDSNMPGGMTVSGHINDPTTLSKISQGTWDYVVIQEQSQIPTIDYYRYNDMYPAMIDLKTLVEQFNPCTRIITYMTWGRRFGGQQCDPSNTYCSPVFVDFNHMQDSLTSAYMEISDLLNIQCAPVGVTWKNILNDTTIVLHDNDNSHPNLDGSYIAALTLYSSIWKEPSAGITFNAGLASSRALYYQQISDNTVFNSPNDWNLNVNDPLADFSYSVVGTTVTFTDASSSGSMTPLDYFWEFGDGNTSTLQNPSYTYASNGLYTVNLIVSDCIFTDTVSYTIQIGATAVQENDISPVRIFPNPFHTQVKVSMDARYIGSDYILTELSGKIIDRRRVVSEDTILHLNGLSNGLYLLKIGSDMNTPVKLIKN